MPLHEGAGDPAADIRPLEPTQATRAARAARELRSLVLAGRFQSGERLNEVAIAQALGISRGPLREAIQRLTAEGLLTAVSHRGAYVRSISADELKDLYGLRIAVESYAVRWVAVHTDVTERAHLDDLLARTEKILDGGGEVPYPADLDIHENIVQLAHNEELLRTVRDVHAKIHLARARSAYAHDRACQAFDEHRQIIEAINRRDPRAAADALEEHLQAALTNALTILHDQSQ